jgi:signal transduction histidine kinase
MREAPADSEDEIRRRGSLVLQTLPIVLIPVGVVLLAALLILPAGVGPPEIDGAPPPNPAAAILVLVVFFSALILLIRWRRPTLSALALIGFWTLLTVGAVLRNGVESISVALLIIPICIAGLLIDGVAAVSLTALATVLVVSLAWLSQRGLTTTRALPPIFPEGSEAIAAAVFWVGLFWTIAALTALLSRGLQRALRESRERATALRRLTEELEARVQAQTAELLAQAEERAVLEERARLSREIHDTIAQGLAGVVVQIGAARQGLTLLPAAAAPQLVGALQENLSFAEQSARETLAEARRSVWNLRTALLDRGSLHDALAQVAARAPLPAGFTLIGEPWPLAPAVEAALLRAGQEALANAAKHAAASRAELTLRYEAEAIELRIADNGRGLPAAMTERRPDPGPAGGFGLLGIEERVGALGGTLRVSNDGGAVVEVHIPRAGAEPGDA